MPTIKAKIKRGTTSMVVAFSLLTLAGTAILGLTEYRKSTRAAADRAVSIVKEMRNCIDLEGKNGSIPEAEMNRLYRQCWNHSVLIITYPTK